MLDLKSDRCLVIRSGYNRPNLYYEVQLATGSVKGSVQEIRDLISSRFPNESGIVYCFSQKDTEDVARGLRELGLKAACYHANMEAVLRSQVHKQWFLEKINIIVATVAFGMGIDKPNVRFVLHYSTSKSLENYYQESGRAGRDAATAACVLIWRFSDLFRLASMVSAERTGLAKLYQMVEYCLDPVTCRRRLIARHLSDGSWSPTDCLKACDNCRRRDQAGLTERVSNLNVTNLIQATSELLINHQNRKQERVTGPKLVDLMVVNTEIRSVVNGVRWSARSRDDRRFFEYFVAWSLVNHWLKMEFHFTPYSTVCYVVPSRVPDQDVIMMPYAEDLEKTLKHRCEDQQDAGKIVTEPKKKKHCPNPVQTVHIDSDSD
ncbi:ATP-dependent DNA helicase Q1 [Fasciola gigantica]|uniref:ATP-dependent DNA helicase n=1 Tax=Fasciola gigantica TaxID=46835 RepID=A0A504YP85_FASGI|nr:ATP-dependent DNA helicase Q1 [Fasciola gigantica]